MINVISSNEWALTILQRENNLYWSRCGGDSSRPHLCLPVLQLDRVCSIIIIIISDPVETDGS